MIDRTTAQKVYIRVCKDSGFQLSYDRAADLAAKILGTTALVLWVDMDISLDIMKEIAAGIHPSVSNERYTRGQLRAEAQRQLDEDDMGGGAYG